MCAARTCRATIPCTSPSGCSPGNHLHLIVEAESAADLSRGMQALVTRREVANAIRYVVGNYRHHAREFLPQRWRDPLSSAIFLELTPPADAPVAPPRAWMLRVGWKLEPRVRRPAGHEP